MQAPTRFASSIVRQAVACLLLWFASGVSAGGVQTMTVEAARAAAHDGALFLVDIRTPAEWRDSGVPDVAIPLDMTSRDFIETLVALRNSDPTRKVGFICASGGRSGHLSSLLAEKGMDGIVDVSAGVHGREGWRARGLPLRAPDAPVATPVGPAARTPTTR